MKPQYVLIAKYRFKKNKGSFAYFVSPYQFKIMRKFREFCAICGEDIKPKSKLTKYYTKNGEFRYNGSDLFFEITIGDYL